MEEQEFPFKSLLNHEKSLEKYLEEDKMVRYEKLKGIVITKIAIFQQWQH